MSKIVYLMGIAALGLASGCGGSQPQPNMMGGGMDPLASSGSLGTGPAKGNVAKKQPDLGLGGNLNGFRIFDDNSFWNKSYEKAAVDPNSDKLIAKIGAEKPLVATFGASGPDKTPFGIPYVVVSSDAPRVAITFTDSKGSDPGPYPFPLQMPIEAGHDQHAIVIDRDGQKLYEAVEAKVDGAGYKADSGAVWDLRGYSPRKPDQSAADPSGLPVFPGLVRFDEVSDPKGINHVLRFTAQKIGKGFVSPATRSILSADDSALPPMGLHLRLKKSLKINKFPQSTQVILTALKKYGMVLSDTGTDWGLSGAADAHWMDADLAALKNIKGSDFEVLKAPAPLKAAKKEEAGASSSKR